MFDRNYKRKHSLKMLHRYIFSTSVSFVLRSDESSGPEGILLRELEKTKADPKPVEWAALQLSPEDPELFQNTSKEIKRLLILEE